MRGSAGTLLVRTGDLHELVTRVTGLLSGHSVTLRARERFDARVYGVESADMSMLDMSYEVPVRVRTDPLPDFLAVCLPTHRGMAVTHAGRSFDVEAGGRALVGGPGSELVMDWVRDLRLVVVRVELSALRRLANRMLSAGDGELDRLHVDPVMRPEVSRAFLANAELMRDLVTRPGAGPGPLVAARLREQVLTTLLLGQPHSWTDALLTGRERPSASRVREAADMMADRAGEPLTVEAVAREVGLSVRALHTGFRREFDVAPSRYLQQVRLDRAYADLLAAEPGVRVADVARWWGFGNLGRFASAYRARFGLTPGETLRSRRKP